MVVIVLHYSSGTFHLNVLLNECVIAEVKTNEHVCCVRLAVFAEEELQHDLCIHSVLCHGCVPEFLSTLIKCIY